MNNSLQEEDGIVYILTNPSFRENLIKIGKTHNLTERVKQLNTTSLPTPFEIYSAFKTKKCDEIETAIHEAYSGSGNRISSKREFFEINPEKARSFLQKLVKLSDENSEEIFFKDEEVYNSEQIEELNLERKKVKPAFKFEKYNIPTGAELIFNRDKNIKCIVIENNKVKYNEEIYSLSKLTMNLLNLQSANGYNYWKYNDELLSDIRDKIDKEENLEEE